MDDRARRGVNALIEEPGRRAMEVKMPRTAEYGNYAEIDLCPTPQATIHAGAEDETPES